LKIGLSTLVMQRGRSGVGQYVLALARAFLPEAGRHHFTLFVLEKDLPLFEFARPFLRLVPVSERFRSPVKNIAWHQFTLPRLARSLGLDVLHIPSYRRMLWPRPCGLVATIHDLAPFRVPGKYDALRMFYGRNVVPRLARRQDEIIAVSQNTADDVAAFFHVSARHLTVIPNGLDHGRFSPGSREEAKAVLTARHGLVRPFFLYVARLEHPAKNHARLIAAFNRFKLETNSSWKLVLAGSDWHGAKTIHALIRQSRYAVDILPFGFVPDADLPTWYRAADVFVYPSLFEGFGLPPLEAMACGCPVIAPAGGALGETCGPAAVAIDPENTGDIQRQMTRLAGDAALRTRLGMEGIRHARNFCWHRAAAGTLEIYARAHRAHEARKILHAPVPHPGPESRTDAEAQRARRKPAMVGSGPPFKDS
jgi:glycosyltransferase involved in cell wall biosynthesis